MVHLTGGKRGGNVELDRQITALGTTRAERRIRVSVGSADPKRLARANAVIDKLIETEQWDTLRALRDGKVTIADLIDADRKDKTRLTLSRVKLQTCLWDRVVATATGERIEPGAISRALSTTKDGRTKARYIDSFEALQAKAASELPVDARVADLETLDWSALAERWGASGADWMHLRRAVSRFATLYFGDKYDPFARALRAKIPTKKVNKRRPRLSIEQFVRITELAPPHAAAADWVLAVTGVRVGEYLASTRAHLNAATHTYDVPGTKTAGSEAPVEVDARWWIFLERGIPSRLGYKWLHEHWTRACVAAGVGRRVGTGKWITVPAPRPAHRPKATDGPRPMIRVEKTRYVGPTLHDLRHCHGQWAVNAGVQESKVQRSLRHENAGQTRDYVMQEATREVSAALADRILGAPPEKKPARRKA